MIVLSRLDGLFHFDHQDAPLVKQALRTEKPQFLMMPLSCCLYCDLMMQPCFPRWLMNTRAENRDRPNPSWLPLLPMFSPATPGRKKSSCHRPASSLFLLLASALLLQHLLDDLLLLDQERTDDAVAHAVAAPRTTVCALDGLLGLGDLGVLAGPQGRDLKIDSG